MGRELASVIVVGHHITLGPGHDFGLPIAMSVKTPWPLVATVHCADAVGRQRATIPVALTLG